MPPIELILAPCHLGLRPPKPGIEPGTWRAPDVLRDAGLEAALASVRTRALPRPRYLADAQPGTRIRNGQTIRAVGVALAGQVREVLDAGRFPVVVGGDCSILLGCLLGLRQHGGRGLVHVDGHSDFFHPGNYDAASILGAAAGMDLALATGRGEPTLTEWSGLAGPLVDDADVVQLGERDALNEDWTYGDIARTAVTQLTIQELRRDGVDAAVARTLQRLAGRGLDRAWLHVDLDVLDQAVMPAVDSPGSPGLDFDALARLGAGLVRSGRVAGADFTIYDPDLDPRADHAEAIVSCIGTIVRPASPSEDPR